MCNHHQQTETEPARRETLRLQELRTQPDNKFRLRSAKTNVGADMSPPWKWLSHTDKYCSLLQRATYSETRSKRQCSGNPRILCWSRHKGHKWPTDGRGNVRRLDAIRIVMHVTDLP
eukprot:383153-Amphidinium_carterae.4